MTNLKVPYAVCKHSGRIVKACNASKSAIYNCLRLELEDSGKILFQQKCPGLEGRSCQRQSLITGVRPIESWTEVTLEAAYKNYRLDVAVVNGSDVVYGFEVFHRHKVPEPKASQLEIPWMELVAEDILAFKPRIPFGYSKSKRLCPDCFELQQCLWKREPEDKVRQNTSKDYLQDAAKLQKTWRGIIEDARKFDREMRN